MKQTIDAVVVILYDAQLSIFEKNYSQAYDSFLKLRDKYLLKFFINQVIYGKYRLQNIKMIIKGILDYKSKKYGKIIHEQN